MKKIKYKISSWSLMRLFYYYDPESIDEGIISETVEEMPITLKELDFYGFKLRPQYESVEITETHFIVTRK